MEGRRVSDTLLETNDILHDIFEEDKAILAEKNADYGEAWKARGGRGVWHQALTRKWDRMEVQVQKHDEDIFVAIENDDREEGILDDIGDLRRYLALVEAEMRRRTIVSGDRVSVGGIEYEAMRPGTTHVRIHAEGDRILAGAYSPAPGSAPESPRPPRGGSGVSRPPRDDAVDRRLFDLGREIQSVYDSLDEEESSNRVAANLLLRASRYLASDTLDKTPDWDLSDLALERADEIRDRRELIRQMVDWLIDRGYSEEVVSIPDREGEGDDGAA